METIIIIGGGLAGLAAANALTDSSRKVVLLEQAVTLGGRARTVEEQGYFMNIGPHALYRGGRTMQMLAEWNIPVSAKAPVLADGAYMVYGEQNFPFVRDAKGLLQTKMFTLKERASAALVLGALSTGSSEPGQSVEQWLQSHTKSPKVQEFIRSIFRVSTYASDLSRLDARAALDQVALSRSHGVLYLDGGWQSMVEGLAARAISRGVEIRCGEHVKDLTALPASQVILAVGPADVERLTGRSLPTLTPARMACLTVGLRKLPDNSALFALGVDCPLYYSVHSHWARVAPEGQVLIHLGKYMDDRPSDPATDRTELERFADLSMPGWRDLADVVHFLPSMTVTHCLPTPEGRPAMDALGMDSVVLAGDWVGPDGMLADAATSSGLAAAHRTMERKSHAA
jgi:glycine/D-amino acid oxidase-like deaminating enzyme